MLRVLDCDGGVFRPGKVIRGGLCQRKEQRVTISDDIPIGKPRQCVEEGLLIGKHCLPRPGEVLSLSASLTGGLLRYLVRGKLLEEGIERCAQGGRGVGRRGGRGKGIGDLPQVAKGSSVALLLLQLRLVGDMRRLDAQDRGRGIACADETQGAGEQADIAAFERELYLLRLAPTQFFEEKRAGLLGGRLLDMSLVEQIAARPVGP